MQTYLAKVNAGWADLQASACGGGKSLVNRHPDAAQAEQGDRNAEQEKQGVGSLFRECVWQWNAALTERRAEFSVLFTQEVGHLNMKKRKGETEQYATKF
jgi:hypothetical protein